jgi:hypothetical protein
MMLAMNFIKSNTVQELIDLDNEIDQLITQEIISDNPDLTAISDGIINYEDYYSAKFKIMWILKEPYDEVDENENASGGGWHLREVINKRKTFQEYENGKGTFKPMIYATWGIFNDFCLWDNMNDVENDPSMLTVLKNIAYINVKKLPGRKTSNNSEIANAYRLYNRILLKQIWSYNPDIIIGGYTLKLFLNDLGLKREEMVKNGSLDYIIKDNKVFIDAYHPAQRKGNTGVSQEQYCDDIINTVKIYSKIVNSGN